MQKSQIIFRNILNTMPESAKADHAAGITSYCICLDNRGAQCGWKNNDAHRLNKGMQIMNGRATYVYIWLLANEDVYSHFKPLGNHR